MTTQNNPLASSCAHLPTPYDQTQADTAWERLIENVTAPHTDTPQHVATFFAAARADGPGARLLTAIFGASPFLTSLILRDPVFTHDMLTSDWRAHLNAILPRLKTHTSPTLDRRTIMAQLRQAKRHMALALGMCDLAGLLPVMTVTRYLTNLADVSIKLSLEHLMQKAITDGHLTGPDPRNASATSGLFVMAMGKMGACELNYSSDIDIIVLYDPHKVTYTGRKSLPELYIRLTRDLSTMLQEYTSDGYVFRVDLRLRPDAGATQPAISVQAAETYYENQGQNWERAAMIKARIAAGDDESGAAFLASMRPFVWRKYLDFASIEDIQSLKQQFHQHKGHASFAVAGHNIKLGKGGIREVELFAQTQQLIMGGKIPSLRDATTLGALDALVTADHLSPKARDTLAAGYGFLRIVEHRLQMLHDTQTQTLPTDPEDLERLARFCGFASAERFSETVLETLKSINTHYSKLFAQSDSLSSTHGNLVFTGTEPDPETITTLKTMGFADPDMVWRAIRTWHHGRFRATSTARAREILTRITPFLLHHMAETDQPDQTFMRLDSFIRNLPSGVQIFSLMANYPPLFEQLKKIFSTAPQLATYLAHRPQVLDTILSPDFKTGLSDKSSLMQELNITLKNTRSYEDILLDIRRFTNDKRFQIGMRWLRNPTEGDAATAEYSLLADVVCQNLLPHVQHSFATQHGNIKHGSFAVVALGKLGSREMAPQSDMDLIFIYHAPSDATQSTGPRPLAVSQYYTRLSQRFINALTAMTPEGTLYEVDMRLRPSGESGPLATSFARFVDYQHKEAWTWEHMALCRARVITGPAALTKDIQHTLKQALAQPRDPEKLRQDVQHMRQRIRESLGSTDIWNLKYTRGGLMELELMAQALTLLHAHDQPKILRTHTTQAFLAFQHHGVLPPETAQAMAQTSLLYQNLNGIKRLCLNSDHHEPEKWPKSLHDSLVEAAEVSDFQQLEQHLKQHQDAVDAQFDALLAD